MQKRSGDDSRVHMDEMLMQNPPLGVGLDWSNPLNKDLVMHLAMNEGHGDVVRDLSMYGNHGTLKNMAFPPTVASGWNPGRTGVGLNFDGTNDYVDCGNNGSLNIADAITISAWININTVQDCAIQAKGSTYRFKIQGGNQLRGLIWVGGAIKGSRGTVGEISINEWNHIVMRYDKNDGTNKISLYLNGVETVYASQDDTGGAAIDAVATDLWLGGIPSYHFPGTLDQVRIHNRALTAKEIGDYYINPWQVYLQ